MRPPPPSTHVGNVGTPYARLDTNVLGCCMRTDGNATSTHSIRSSHAVDTGERTYAVCCHRHRRVLRPVWEESEWRQDRSARIWTPSAPQATASPCLPQATVFAGPSPTSYYRHSRLCYPSHYWIATAGIPEYAIIVTHAAVIPPHSRHALTLYAAIGRPALPYRQSTASSSGHQHEGTAVTATYPAGGVSLNKQVRFCVAYVICTRHPPHGKERINPPHFRVHTVIEEALRTFSRLGVLT